MSDNNSIEIKDLKVAYGEIVVLENMNLENETNTDTHRCNMLIDVVVASQGALATTVFFVFSPHEQASQHFSIPRCFDASEEGSVSVCSEARKDGQLLGYRCGSNQDIHAKVIRQSVRSREAERSQRI